MTLVHPFDVGDLDPTGYQQQIWDALLDAITFDQDPAGFLFRQDCYTAADRLQVAYLWGGPELQEELCDLLYVPSGLGV